ncbi:hypothetical protein GCM10022248_22490 [Nonomuraea soli]
MTDEGIDSPWSDGPLMDSGAGSAVCIGISWSRVEVAGPFVTQAAEEHGLVCYDPHAQRLLP